MTDQTEQRDELVTALEERGVSQSEKLIWELGDDANFDAVHHAIARCDEEDIPTSGLLVYRIRAAAKSRYRPPAERKRINGSDPVVTPRLLASIRGSLNTPDGISREEAHGLYAARAKRLGMPVDDLINAAMGSDWQETPRHPMNSPERYAEWVSEAPA